MILIFGGTTEGKRAAAVCDQAGKPFYYSTKTDRAKTETAHGIPLAGGMDADQIAQFCKENGIDLMIDAAHPFAENLHRNIETASIRCRIPVIRYERIFPERDPYARWFHSYEQAVAYLLEHPVKNLLALSGVNTISKLRRYWTKHDSYFRILDRKESHEIVERENFPADRILYYENSDLQRETELFRKINPGAILTKESGLSGGFPQKLAAAKASNIPLLVIAHPQRSDAFIPVTGNHTLRREIEKRLPDFFELKTGYTTGVCATAATKAALYALLTGNEPAEIPITLPDGETLTLPILETEIRQNSAMCTVRKDGGDDPDVTHGIAINSTVELSPIPGIRFLQGEGVGKVTLPGIDIPVGEPAINKTPRAMMESEIRKLLATHDLTGSGVHVTISVPEGREIATRTFNPRLGIEGGISIIGTSGIVKPFSTEAFLGAIQKQMEIAKALLCDRIVINSGAKSEGIIKKEFPDIPQQAFIHFGNFIGETIRIAAEMGFEKLTLGIMVGKAVKLAEGHLDTHSKHTVMNREFLKQIAQEAGYGEDTGRKIDGINLARQLWELFPEQNSGFWRILLEKCYSVCSPLFTSGKMEILLIGEKGEIISGYNSNSHT